MVLDVVVILIASVPQIVALTVQDVPYEWLGQLCVAGGAVALWWRRSHPLAVLLIVAALAGFNPLYSGLPNAGNFEVMFAAYALAVHTRLRTTVLGYLASALTIPVAGALAASVGVRDGALLLGPQPMALVALAIGVAVRASNSRREAVEELAALREERAVSAERARITAEMHDVVAHSATVMIALAGGARAGWGETPRASPGRAGTTGHRRRASARRHATHPPRAARRGRAVLDAGLAHSGHNIPPLDELVRVFAAAGLNVELRAPDALPDDPALRTTLYRIVQESLTNALRHGASVTRATVGRDLARRRSDRLRDRRRRHHRTEQRRSPAWLRAARHAGADRSIRWHPRCGTARAGTRRPTHARVAHPRNDPHRDTGRPQWLARADRCASSSPTTSATQGRVLR